MGIILSTMPSPHPLTFPNPSLPPESASTVHGYVMATGQWRSLVTASLLPFAAELLGHRDARRRLPQEI